MVAHTAKHRPHAGHARERVLGLAAFGRIAYRIFGMSDAEWESARPPFSAVLRPARHGPVRRVTAR